MKVVREASHRDDTVKLAPYTDFRLHIKADKAPWWIRILASLPV